MIAPAVVLLAAAGVAVGMLVTVTAWADALAAVIWTLRIRPRLSALVLVIVVGAWLGLLGLLYLLLHALLAFSTGAMAVWLAPFIAVPALNALARWRDPAKVASLPLPGTRVRLTTHIYDVERARARVVYQPPPVI